ASLVWSMFAVVAITKHRSRPTPTLKRPGTSNRMEPPRTPRTPNKHSFNSADVFGVLGGFFQPDNAMRASNDGSTEYVAGQDAGRGAPALRKVEGQARVVGRHVPHAAQSPCAVRACLAAWHILAIRRNAAGRCPRSDDLAHWPCPGSRI